ncbi:hypothetical protein TA3x_003972 [Tundrisphaera sp. TA3]|uniref:hypothetical protein n=1 Tax=Tundrisphaera sp. TA3 TaxID=3435775 RepID=UPI003EB97FC6
MRIPRLSVRAMMLIVAVVAVLSLGARQYLDHRERLRLFRSSSNSIGGSLGVQRDRRAELRVGEPFPVTIDYNVGLRRRKPPPGVLFPVWGEAWIEDAATGQAVDGFSFEVTLATGGMESAKGSLAWDAVIPKPGKYSIKHYLWYKTPLGEWQGMSGGSQSGLDIAEGK